MKRSLLTALLLICGIYFIYLSGGVVNGENSELFHVEQSEEVYY